MTRPTVVVLALTGTGVAVARALAPNGVRVVGVDGNQLEVGHFSRWIERVPDLSHARPGPEFVAALEQFARREPVPPIIFPCSDDYLQVVVDQRDRLDKVAVLYDALRPHVAGLCLDKGAFYRKCQQAGLDMPATFFPVTWDDVAHALAEVRYPCILKPVFGHRWRGRLHGRKVMWCRRREDALATFRRLVDDPCSVVVQEVVEGPEDAITVAACHIRTDGSRGECVTARKLRQFPPDFGSGSLLRSEHLPDIASISFDFLEKLDFRGICGTEFKWDAREGRHRLLEINPRPTLWFDLCRAAGTNLMWEAYCDLARLAPATLSAPRPGVVWQYLARDVGAALEQVRRRPTALPRVLRSFMGPRVYCIESLDDLGATLASPVYSLANAFNQLRGRSR